MRLTDIDNGSDSGDVFPEDTDLEASLVITRRDAETLFMVTDEALSDRLLHLEKLRANETTSMAAMATERTIEHLQHLVGILDGTLKIWEQTEFPENIDPEDIIGTPA